MSKGFCRLHTGIDSLDSLLIDEKRKPGILYARESGLFSVIFGAAGSGKSILGLQLACNFTAQSKRAKPCHAVFISTEAPTILRAKIERHFSFFQVKRKNRPRLLIEESIPHGWQSANRDKRNTLTLLRMPLEKDRQKAKLDYLLPSLAGLCPEGGQNRERLLLCIDNAEAISREAFPVKASNLNVSSNVKAEPDLFFKQLRAYCARHTLNAWFTFEEEKPENTLAEDMRISTTAEAYAADIVIRLGVRVCENGYRERTLEIVKAKHQAYRRGRHHFTIRGAPDKMPPLGVIVYPSLATQLYVLGRHDQPETESEEKRQPLPKDCCKISIEAIDAAIATANPGYESCLASGTVSVLVSDLDSMANEIALHFALQDPVPSLYFTTYHNPDRLWGMVDSYPDLKKNKKELNIKHLPPEHISEGKLLHDIQARICKFKQDGMPLRVVFDNVFALSKKFPLLDDERHFLAALLDMFRRKRVTALVLDTVEVGEGRNPLNESFAAGLADHVFSLRHVELRSHVSKVFSIVKLASLREPKTTVWELARDSERIEARDSLAFFKGFLTGKPEPVKVILSLFSDAEGCPLDDFLQTQQKVLRQTFGQGITIHQCHSDSYAAFQQGVGSNIAAVGDCHVISIDEIWLEKLMATKKLADLGDFLSKDWKDWEHGEYVTTAQDIALCTRSGPPVGKENFAIPDRNNVGVLTCNSDVLLEKDINPNWLQFARGLVPPNLPQWKQLVELQTIYLANLGSGQWTGSDGCLPLSLCSDWERCRNWKTGIQAHPHQKAEGLPTYGAFTFSMDQRESCVSFLIELLLGCLDDGKDWFKQGTGRIDWNVSAPKSERELLGIPNATGKRTAWGTALSLMLHLLSPWDIQRLSYSGLRSGWRPAIEERQCLFSRQWYSGWNILEVYQPGLRYQELPPGVRGKPTPVSGAWYLGMLWGSTAQDAGRHLIKHLTSPQLELLKVNRGIGLPVRTRFYDKRATEVRQPPPYAERFRDIAKLQKDLAEAARQVSKLEESIREPRKKNTPEDTELVKEIAELKEATEKVTTARKAFDEDVLNSMTPFYRSRMEDYGSVVSPLLMGLIVRVARIVLEPKYSEWLWGRNNDLWTQLGIRGRIECEVTKVKKQYDPPDRK